MDWIYQFERKHRNFGISDLMKYIVITQAIVYVADAIMTNLNLISLLSLNMAYVLKGQVWRLVTFLIIPPQTSVIFIIFALYFYYILGSALEADWGTCRFNLYYIIGIIGCLLTAVITGSASNTFLNLSLFFAFAILFPDFEFLLFFILPVKVKYLAILDAVIYVIQFVMGPWSTRVAILFSLVNLFLFFGKDMIAKTKKEISYLKTRNSFRRNNKNYWK